MTNEGPEDVEAMLDSLDPAVAGARDAVHIRAIMRAVEARTAADEAVTAAVESARAAGDAWTIIGMALEMTTAEAKAKYQPVIDAWQRLIDSRIDPESSVEHDAR